MTWKTITAITLMTLAILVQAGRQTGSDLFAAKVWADTQIIAYADSVRGQKPVQVQQLVQVDAQAMPQKIDLPPSHDPAVIEAVTAANRVLAANLPKTKGIN